MVMRLAGSCLCLFLGVTSVLAEDQQEEDGGDRAKTIAIERPARLLVAASAELQSNAKASQKPSAAANPSSDESASVARDAPQRVIEIPLKRLVADDSKYDLEAPVQQAVALAAPISPPSTAVPDRNAPANSKVQPGDVKWHPDFATACAASKKSGKPVLHFQLLGNLDDRFC